jgi:predicted GNAT superfamily acetyltransferase
VTAAPTFEIRNLERAAEMASIATVFQQVWGTTTPIVNVELLCAIAHSGGYVAAVYEHERVMGASFGFLARHAGAEALHSHVTGVLPGIQHGGVGRAVKQHQREWAAARSIPWITWTFDPLVRRNAWFNIEVLGAHVAEYLVDFYGPMSDAINANDESDRLLVAWPTGSEPALRGAPLAAAGSATATVPTPDDIVALRRTDPASAMSWRHQVRRQLAEPLAAGGVVTGFTRAGEYELSIPALVPDGVDVSEE